MAIKDAPGRPVKHKTPEARKQANREAARRYRAKKKAELASRRDESNPVSSKTIDLSSVAPWKRR